MKSLRTISMLAAAVLSMTLMPSCLENLDPENSAQSQILHEMSLLNSSCSINDDIEFMYLTPYGLGSVKGKHFVMSAEENEEYKELNGKSFFALFATGEQAYTECTLCAYSQNLSKSRPGEKLSLKRVSFGCMYSSSADYAFGEYKGGDIYVKSVTDSLITLRFAKVKTYNALGNFYYNGDLTFKIGSMTIE